tara:strand:+ start:2840 stop:4117 length:1278 start_codon:yes stop_codon:yes gene_type:complete
MTVRIEKPAFNLRDKISQLDLPVGLHGSQLLRSQTAEETFRLARAGRRRLNVNGDMKVCQRATTTTGQTAANFHGPDMAINYLNVGTWTISQDQYDVPPTGEFTHSLKYQCTSAQTSIPVGSYLYLIQRIEAVDSWQVQFGTTYAKPVSASFWVKSNKTGSVQVNLENENNNGPSSGDMVCCRRVRVNSPNTWEYKTVTFPGDTNVKFDYTTAKGLVLDIGFSAGTNYNDGDFAGDGKWLEIGNTKRFAGCDTNWADSTSNYINITGVQIEIGETSTPYEHRPYGEELALCMRRCQILGSQYMLGPGGYAPAQNEYNCIGRGWTRSVGSVQTMSFLPVPFLKMPTAAVYSFDNVSSPTNEFYVQYNGNSSQQDCVFTGINSQGSNLHSIWLDWDPVTDAGSVTPCHVGSKHSAAERNGIILQAEI